MINFVTMPSPSGSAYACPVGPTGSKLGVPFRLSCFYPFLGFIKEKSGDVISRRALGDYISTSPMMAYGNHACSNMQITGELSVGGSTEFIPVSGFNSYDPYAGDSSIAIQRPLNGRFYSDVERMSVTSRVRYYYSTHPMIADRSGTLLGGDSGNFTFVAAHPRFNSGGHASCVYSARCMIGGCREDGVIVQVRSFLEGTTWEKYQTDSYKIEYDIRAMSVDSASRLREAFWYPSLGWTKSYKGTTAVVLSRESFEAMIISDVAFLGNYDMSCPSYDVLPETKIPPPSNYPSLTFASDGNKNSWTMDRVRYVRKQCASFHRAFQSEVARNYYDFRPLHDTIMDSVPYVDNNSIAFVRDLRTTFSSLKSIGAVMAQPTNPKQWAKLWLSARYGDRLTIADAGDYFKAFTSLSRRSRDEKDYNVIHARGTQTSSFDFLGKTYTMRHELFSTCALRPANLGPLCDFIRNSINWDIWPTLENSWDLIPFSFVVDWFANVSEVASAVDRRILANYYDILYVIDSVKHTVSFDGELCGATGVLDWSWYDRKISTSLSFSPFRCDAGHLSTRNVIDGVSLIIQAV